MSQELAVQQQPSVPSMRFSNEDVELIRDTICKGATDSEFKLFINQAKTLGLNPLARQIFAVKRPDYKLGRDVMTIQVSIDGFRLIAERTGKYAGQVGPQWCGDDGVWHDVWTKNTPPCAARVGALRGDFKEPCWGVARFNSYAQKKKDGTLFNLWGSMGDVMIAKCAEALALRKAFPQELSGVYSSDEMAQASLSDETAAAEPAPKSAPIDKKIAKLTQDAKDFAQEIGLCDTSYDLENLVRKNATITADLAKELPDWHKRLIAVIEKQRDALAHAPEQFVEEDPARNLMAG